MGNKEIPNGFKMTELGPLPDEWEVVRLGDVFDFSKKPRSLNIEHNDLIPFIPMEYIPDDGIYSGKYDLKRPEEIKSGSFFFKGDLLVAKITPSFENGKQCVVEELPTDFGYATTEVWPIHETDRTEILHLFYYLKRREIRTDIASKMEGSTGRQRVPKNVLENFNVPLPPLPEQRVIANVLSTVQAAKEKAEAVISATKELKKSLMKHLFTYGPVPVEEAENVPLKETEVGLVPEEWGVTKIGDAFNVKQGKQLSSREKTGGKIKKPFLRTSNVFWGKIDTSTLDSMPFSPEEFEKLNLRRGDVLVCEGGDIGRTALWDGSIEECAYQNHLHRLRSKDADTIDHLIFALWMEHAMKQRNLYIFEGNVTTIPNLSSSRLKNFKIPLPPLPEQKKIASILSAVDEKIEKEETKKKSLEELFKTILHNLMTGKLRVNHLDV
jgi:type I restriction enzyme S subunit